MRGVAPAALFVAAAGLFHGPALAAAAELVMFEEPGCPWCARWDAEVGRVYANTDEGRRLPLRRLRRGEALPPDLPRVKGVFATPTFVVIACGQEIGRIVGYPGEAFFYGLLGELIGKIDRKQESRSC